MAILADKLNVLVDYIDSWRKENGIDESGLLTDDQLAKLTKDIELKINELKIDFKGPVDGANVTPYTW